MLWAEIWKISKIFAENFPFLVVKFSIYLNRRVYVMNTRTLNWTTNSQSNNYFCHMTWSTQNVNQLMRSIPQKRHWQTKWTQIRRTKKHRQIRVYTVCINPFVPTLKLCTVGGGVWVGGGVVSRLCTGRVCIQHYKLHSCICRDLTLVLVNPDIPTFANSVEPDQLASEEANSSGSALFAIQYSNLY